MRTRQRRSRIDATHLTHRRTGGHHLTLVFHPNAVRILRVDGGRWDPSPSIVGSATALNNNALLPCLFTFDDDDDPGPLSIDWVPLELEFGPEVEDAFERFEIDDDAAATAAAFAAAALSTLFKNGLGKISSSAKSSSGEGWLLGTGVGRGAPVRRP